MTYTKEKKQCSECRTKFYEEEGQRDGFLKCPHCGHIIKVFKQVLVYEPLTKKYYTNKNKLT